MLAASYSTVHDKFQEYCDKVSDERETVIVTRDGEKNIVLLGLREYNEMLQAVRNSEYLDGIDRSISQLDRGEGIVKSMAELEAMARD